MCAPPPSLHPLPHSLHPHLLDPAFIVPAVASKADALAAAAVPDWAPLDARGRAHLQTACLAAATGAVLAPFVRDDDATLAIVADSAGARADAPARALLAGAAWATRMAGGDPVAAAGRRLTGLLADKGSAARGEVAVTPDAATLTVTACAAHAVCSSPDLDRGLRWLPALCCSAESGLFPGLACERRAWLGGGDGACVVRVGRGEGER